MRSYEAARTLFSFLGFIAWSVIVIGVLVALVGAGSVSQYAGGGAGLLAMVPGFGIAIAGFILLAFVQMGRAGVDTAEYTQQMLKISRDQLEVSKQALRGNSHEPKRFEAIQKPELSAKPSVGFEKADFRNSVDTSPKAATPTPVEEEIKAIQNGETTEYLGHQISRKADEYFVGGKSLYTLNLARRHIEKNLRELSYKGTDIVVQNGKYVIDEKPFENIVEAKDFIDNGARSSKPLPDAWKP